MSFSEKSDGFLSSSITDCTLSLIRSEFPSPMSVVKVNSLSRLAQGTPDGELNAAVVAQNAALKSSALQVSQTSIHTAFQCAN